MNPDSLRALVGEEFDSLTHRQHILAHADAWEEDRADRVAANRKLQDADNRNSILLADNAALRDECQVLRQRLEAEVKLQIEFRKGLPEQNGLVLTLNKKLEAAKRILISEGWDAHKLDDALDARAWPYGAPSESET